jgi:hypothetical protein
VTHEFSTVPTEDEKMHEDRAMRLMREMRAVPPPNNATWCGEPFGWVRWRPQPTGTAGKWTDA